MQTYTHFLLTLALYRLLGQFLNRESSTLLTETSGFHRHLPKPVPASAVLWGSVLPDLPLIFISVVCIVVDMTRNSKNGAHDENDSWTSQLFSTWYFKNPWVKAAHNIFHSPITLTCMLGAAYCISKSQILARKRSATWIFWLLSACFLHTLCDIPVHHDDGPLILFPINWEYRFHSPLSYWDPEYHGQAFAVVEHIFDVTIVLWECSYCCWRRTTYQPVGNQVVAEISLSDATTPYRDEEDEITLATMEMANK